MDIKRVMSAVPRAGNLLNPLTRSFRLAALALIILILYLNIPSRRPTTITSRLVLKTSDLLEPAAAVTSKSSSDEHAVSSNDSSPSSKHVMSCSPDIPSLREIRDTYDLDDEIEYLKRYVRFTREPIERQSYTTLQQSFLPDSDMDQGFQLLRMSGEQHLHEGTTGCRDALEVPVPQSPFPADVDLSDFIFGMSTNYERLSHPSTIKEWTYWLTDGNGKSNGGKLVLRLVDASDPELTDVVQRLAKAGIDAEVSAVNSQVETEMAVRNFNLVPILFSHEQQSSTAKKWFVLCDDDTFFTAMNRVVATFSQYDATKPLYIGTLSEDVNAVRTHGSHAYGGGGIFLSRPLVSIISSLQGCTTRAKIKQSNSGWGPQGDIILRQCIYENTNIRMIHQKDLWQLDFKGDPAGFYEAGLQPFSVHHFKGGEKIHTAYPLNSTMIAHTCGEDCPYLRFITADNFIISNGYSIAQYPDGIDFNLDQVEHTFQTRGQDKVWNFDFTWGPQRPSLHKTGKKVAWELRESQRMEDGAVSQVYIRKKDDERWTTAEGRPMKTFDGIIELVWMPA